MSLVKTQELNKLQQSKGKYTIMYIQVVHVHVYQSDLGQAQYIKYLCTSTHSHRTYSQIQVHFFQIVLKYMYNVFFLYHSNTVSSTNTTSTIYYVLS